MRTPLVTILALVVALCVTLAAEAQAPAIVSVENEFVRAVVNRGPAEAGRFSVRTTGGDAARPDSQNQPLVYGGNAPWTSFTTVRVDGVDYVFGGNTMRRAGSGAQFGTPVSEPKSAGGHITCTYRYGDIEITQDISLARSLYSRMVDGAEVTYALRNTGAVPHQVGLRVVLDTMCGRNDGAAIRPSDMKEITSATWLVGSRVPQFYQAFDSLSSPVVIAQGTLRGGANTPPDRVLFADWGTLADEIWEPAVAADRNFMRVGEDELDTAAALFWNASTLEAGQTRTCTTTYGMGSVDVKVGGITAGLTCQAEATYEYERTQPLTVMGYIENAKDFEARNVVATLTLPEGLELVGGSRLRRVYGNIKPGDLARQENWVLRPNGKAGGRLTLVLTVTSDNLEESVVKRVVEVAVPPPAVALAPARQSVPAEVNGLPAIAIVEVSIKPADGLFGAELVLTYDAKVVALLGVSRGRAFVEDGGLLPGWTCSADTPGEIRILASRRGAFALTQAEAHIATLRFRTLAPGTSAIKATSAAIVSERGNKRNVDLGAATIQVLPNTAP